MSEVLEYQFEQSSVLAAPPGQVFEFLDDFEQLGAHMMHASWMMAGSRMHYEFDPSRGRAPGAMVRITGSFLGMGLEINEQITGRFPPRAKSWRTCAAQRMLILSAYYMGFTIDPEGHGSRVRVFIEYSIPPRGLGRWLGKLFAPVYARWCVRSMLDAAVHRFGADGRFVEVTSETHTGATP